MAPHNFGLGRPDPFFQTRKPHSQNFLESMHRTYGQPAGGLPRRDEETFKRALEFRRAEKAKYLDMETDNASLRAQVEQLHGSHAALRAETDKIKALWEQLSKANLKHAYINLES